MSAKLDIETVNVFYLSNQALERPNVSQSRKYRLSRDEASASVLCSKYNVLDPIRPPET